MLDTTVLSALMRSEPRAAARLLETPPSAVLVPQPSIAEIRYGLERLPSSRRRTALEARFELLAGALQRIEWTDAVSNRFGAIKADLERRGVRVDDFDVAIAAHAAAHEAAVATANVRHFARVPGLVVDDWGS